MREPLPHEVYLFKGTPVLVLNTGRTWIHGHRYAVVVAATWRGVGEYTRVLEAEWHRLEPLVSNEGTVLRPKFVIHTGGDDE